MRLLQLLLQTLVAGDVGEDDLGPQKMSLPFDQRDDLDIEVARFAAEAGPGDLLQEDRATIGASGSISNAASRIRLCSPRFSGVTVGLP